MKKLSKRTKIAWILILIIILAAGLYSWVFKTDWITYRNEDYGFSFMYPSSWHIKPDIISKEKFDKGQYAHGDFGGFIFYVVPEEGSVDSESARGFSPGGVKVSFYKKMPADIQKGSRPVGYGEKNMVKFGEKLGFTNESFTNKYFYLETENYVYEVFSTASSSNASIWLRVKTIYYHQIGSRIIDSFHFWK